MSLRYRESESCSVVSDSLWPYGLYSPWTSRGQDNGVGSLSLLHGIFPTQGSNPGLPYCRWILYQLSHNDSRCIMCSVTQFSSVQSLSSVRLFETPWIAARQASLSITNSWSSPKPCPSSPWCHPTISSSVVPFSSCPQSFPASGSFPMSQLFTWGGQSTGVSASASVPPKNTQDWSPLEWTGWISLQSKGLSRVFPNTTVQKHQFFGAQPSSQSNSHIHTWPWKNHSLD